MDLKVGDLVAFKKYENMTDELKSVISKESFPEFGKVSTVYDAIDCFEIEEEQYVFSQDFIDYIIVKAATNEIHVGDEVLVKTTVKEVFSNFIQVDQSIGRTNVINILKRKEPEHFIVKEDYYGMYINGSEVLVVNKDDAKIYNSRDEANEAAADMHLNAWEVLPYDA